MTEKYDLCQKEQEEFDAAILELKSPKHLTKIEAIQRIRQLSHEEIDKWSKDPNYIPKGFESGYDLADRGFREASRMLLKCRKTNGWPE